MVPAGSSTDRRVLRPLRGLSAVLAALGAALVVASPTAAITGWSAPVRAAPPSAGVVSSMVLDGAGHIHIAAVDDLFGQGGAVRYATNASGHWVTTIVDAHRDSQPSMALAGGRVYIAYVRSNSSGTRTGIWLAHKASGSWVSMRVTTGADWMPSLQMRAGHYYIAYLREAAAHLALRFATDDTAIPDRLIDGNCCYFASGPSLRLDSIGRPIVAYEGPASSRGIMKAAYYLGFWTFEPVATGLDFGPFLDLDPGDQPHIAYTQDAPGAGATATYYAHRELGSFVSELVRAGNNGADDLAARADGHVSILISNGNGVLRYATNTTGSWTFTNLSAALPAGWYAGVARLELRAGKPRVAYEAFRQRITEDEYKGIYYTRKL